MSQQQSEILDFSGLFKLDVLLHLDIASYSFYEIGQKKFFAFASDKEFVFIYIDPQLERFEKSYDWDFLDNPIHCMCFEPSGTWLIIVSDQKVLLVPFLPLFIPQNTFDQKWSLSRVTVLPLGNVLKPSSLVCWLTKESENILIIGSKTGTISFYSLESQTILGDCKVTGEITDLQICFDDSLDLLTLLVSVSKLEQCKLVLEHRSLGYNWLQQIKAQNDRDRRDSFMSYIKQLSKDKITFFTQSGSKDENKSQTVEHVLKPTEYLPLFRKGSNNWALTAQYVNGRHFLTAFELNEGTIILESPEENSPSRTLRPFIKKDALYIQALWSQRILYLIRKNEVEVHSANFSALQGESVHGTKRDYSELWRAELIGEVRRAHLMSAKEPCGVVGGWREPTFMCDLQVPRFAIEPCLIITNLGAYILNTVSDASEWLVGVIMRGGVGAEQSCDALGAQLPALLRAAADMLLSRGKLEPAHYLYFLSQSAPDGWMARLGVFGRFQELAQYKQTGNLSVLGNVAITVKLLAMMLKLEACDEQHFDPDIKLTLLTQVELLELTTYAVAIGLWNLIPVFSIHRGHPYILLSALKSRNNMCRGAIDCLLRQRCLVPLLLEENGQWLFDYITENCKEFDTTILKCLCLWLNPLQEQLRPVMRDLKQGITSIYTARLQQLIATFVHIACVIESREPCPEMHLEVPESVATWRNQFSPRRALSCGLAHWAVVDDGNAKIMMTHTPVNPELIGRVIDVACGRHHTLVLTENGIYAAGDNTFGQLGVGERWKGGIGDAGEASGALRYVPTAFSAPLASLAAGHYHSAAIDVGGRLYMWGWGVHGQLCLGTINDEWSPKLVTKFQGRKVLSVNGGACHTIVLMKNGEVWACGASVFGQVGQGNRNKASVPLRVPLQDPVVAIAAGYFHNLALTNKGELWTWGASPQQVRAAAARINADAPVAEGEVAPLQDHHLLPCLVDTSNVRGDIVHISAGWHHSCILNNAGVVYTWGLSFDGQLGSGDRKPILIPTEIKIRTDSQPDTVKNNGALTPDVEKYKDLRTNALVACGGDFSVYIDEDGRIYATGNTHIQFNNEKEKSSSRVIMMKTTKRVIKIPSSRNNKYLFQPVDRIDIMFPFDLDDLQRNLIETKFNPLASMKYFKDKSWADNVILILKPWLDVDNFKASLNMAAKFAYHSGIYSDCLRFLLDNLKFEPRNVEVYVTHTPIEDTEVVDETKSTKNEDIKKVIHSVMSKRIKEVSMSILNEETYPLIDPLAYKALPCCCDELSYRKNGVTTGSFVNMADSNISVQAANVIDKCISSFPIDTDLWEVCFRLAKDFYLDNDLCITDLEAVLRKYMASNATTMAAAIMYSNDCSQYSKILSPKFYLNMCSQVLDTWG